MVAKRKTSVGTNSRANAAALIHAGDVRAPALIKRCETVGAALALSPLAETPLGRARLLKAIEEGQYRAGVQFEAVVQIYRMVQGLGSGHPVAIDIMGLGGASLSGRMFEEGEIAAVKTRYGRAYRALNDAGPAAHRVTVDVVMRGAPITDMTLHALRTGLNALSTHFNRGRAPQRILTWNEGGKVSIDEQLWEMPADSDGGGNIATSSRRGRRDRRA